MFRMNIPITKSRKSENGRLLVTGVASGPAIDLDYERFDSNALVKMMEKVNSGGIPIRLEHEDKAYTTVGVWKSAALNDAFVMEVEGEVDTELSLGKDIEVLLKRGEPLSLSVGGKVLDASFEFNKELNKNIKVYRDVLLEEISVVKHPAYSATELTLGKSVNWEAMIKSKKVEQTPEAEALEATRKTMAQLSVEEFSKSCGGKKKKKMVKSWNEVTEMHSDLVLDEYESRGEEIVAKCEDCYESSNNLSTTDMQIVIQVAKFLSEVDVPDTMAIPAQLEDWQFLEALPEEAYVIMDNRRMTLPHHNSDLSVNKEFLAYALKSLFDGQHYYRPKEYAIALNHLYYHLKEAAMLKSKKKKDEKKDKQPMEDEKNKPDMKTKKSIKTQFSKIELDLFKACADYLSGVNARPQNNGEDLTDEAILKMADAYRKLTEGDAEGVELVPADETTPAPEEPKVEEPTVDEPKEEEPKATEPVVEDTKPVDEPKAEEPKVEETPEEPKAAEAAVEEPAKEDAPKVEDEGEITKSLRKDFVTKAEMSAFSKQLGELAGSLSDLAKSIAEDKDKVSTLEKTVNSSVDAIVKLSDALATRKSVVSVPQAIEKNFSRESVNAVSDLDSLVEKKMTEGKSFAVAYKEAKQEFGA